MPFCIRWRWHPTCLTDHTRPRRRLAIGVKASCIIVKVARVVRFQSHVFRFLLQEVKHHFGAVIRLQRAFGLDIYACNNNRDRYIDAPAMIKLADLTLPISDPSKVDPPSMYDMLVRFRFGTTQLEVTAHDKQTKKEVETSMVFVAH